MHRSLRLLARRISVNPTHLDQDDIYCRPCAPGRHRVVRVRGRQQPPVLKNLRPHAVSEARTDRLRRVLDIEEE